LLFGGGNFLYGEGRFTKIYFYNLILSNILWRKTQFWLEWKSAILYNTEVMKVMASAAGGLKEKNTIFWGD